MTTQSRAQRLSKELADQEAWIRDHGGDLLGYVVRYGSKDDPKHFGNGGEAIYEADVGVRDALAHALDRARGRSE